MDTSTANSEITVTLPNVLSALMSTIIALAIGLAAFTLIAG